MTFREEIGQLLDKKFYILVLALPVLGVCVFNILPIVFMIIKDCGHMRNVREYSYIIANIRLTYRWWMKPPGNKGERKT